MIHVAVIPRPGRFRMKLAPGAGRDATGARASSPAGPPLTGRTGVSRPTAYPLSAPPVRPATMYFCASMKSATAGTMARVR